MHSSLNGDYNIELDHWTRHNTTGLTKHTVAHDEINPHSISINLSDRYFAVNKKIINGYFMENVIYKKI